MFLSGTQHHVQMILKTGPAGVSTAAIKYDVLSELQMVL